MGLLDFLKPKETRVKELIYELYGKSSKLEAENKYEEAVQVYDQIINLNPQAVSAHIHKGDALRKMKNYEEAIRIYNKANGIKQDGDAYAGIGFALMELDRYEEAIESFRDSNSAYIKKSDDDFWADYEANQDDYAPGALEAHFKNHYGCSGYEIKKFHELMEKKCEQLVNAGKYREAIKVAYDGLGVVDTPWESYCRYVDRSLKAMGERRMADEFYDKYFEAEDASRWGENDKAADKMRSAVRHVKNQLNIKNESYHIIIDYPDDPVIPSTTPRASDFSSQLPQIIKRHAPKLVIGTIIFFVVFGVLTLIPWNNEDSQGVQQEATNSIGMEFVKIPAGEFMMGSPSDEGDRANDEGPVHKVTIEESYYLGKYEVTQKQWREVMGSNPSYFKGDDLPIEKVSWVDAQIFIQKLNEMEGINIYRLPSEAEWEYACRAGTTTRYYFGNDKSRLGDYAWYLDNLDGQTHPVGQKKPNPWGLYDMHGNVWEWCQDEYHSNYDGAPSNGSAWVDVSGYNWVRRSGGWDGDAGDCRSASRYGDGGNRYNNLGFRVVRSLTPWNNVDSKNTEYLLPISSNQ